MQPRERLFAHGSQALSLTELVAVLLGTGGPGLDHLALAAKLMRGLSEREWLNWVAQHPESLLRSERGLGEAKTARLLAALELARRTHEAPRSLLLAHEARRNPRSSESRDSDDEIFALVPAHLRCAPYEWIGVIPRNGPPTSVIVVETGGRRSVSVHPRDLFGCLLWRDCQVFALVHNHPSGELRPSREDLELTERVRRASQSIGLSFIGHWIVSPKGVCEVRTSNTRH